MATGFALLEGLDDDLGPVLGQQDQQQAQRDEHEGGQFHPRVRLAAPHHVTDWNTHTHTHTHTPTHTHTHTHTHTTAPESSQLRLILTPSQT